MPSAEGFAALAAAIAAGVAAAQIALNRDESNKRAVLTHVREIETRLQELLHLNSEQWTELRQEVLNCYRVGGNLSDNARKYLSFLNALEFAALGVRMQVVDPELLGEYLQTLIGQGVVTGAFVKDLQACYHTSIYKDLLTFMQSRSLR